MAIEYRTWYESAKTELHRVQEEKEEAGRVVLRCDQQIAALTQTMNAIAPLIGEEPPGAEAPAGGMTDSIRTILTQAGEPLSATGIRDRLGARGFDLQAYSNPLATIHTVLRRLIDAKEVEGRDGHGAAPGARKFAIKATKTVTIGMSVVKEPKEGAPKGEVEVIGGKSFAFGKKYKGILGVSRIRRRGKGPSEK